jgi:hypothetical protein
MKRDLEIMVNVRGGYYAFCYADPNCKDWKKKQTWNFLLQNQQAPFTRSKHFTFKMV